MSYFDPILHLINQGSYTPDYRMPGYGFLFYGFFGLIANVALLINIAMILTFLSWLGATLTLPGIAGIVLTMGMAVDANVLIFERMKEEAQHHNKKL